LHPTYDATKMTAKKGKGEEEKRGRQKTGGSSPLLDGERSEKGAKRIFSIFKSDPRIRVLLSAIQIWGEEKKSKQLKTGRGRQSHGRGGKKKRGREDEKFQGQQYSRSSRLRSPMREKEKILRETKGKEKRDRKTNATTAPG